MDSSAYLEHVSADGRRALSTGRAQLDRPVPSCPGWTVADLLVHLGRVHRWVEHIVRTRATERQPFPERPPEGALAHWYEEGLQRLLDTLAAADAHDTAWNWMARAPAPVGFWPRRMAHETAVHRWDAEKAVGEEQPIDAVLATDGVDEYIGIMAFILREEREEEVNLQLHGTLGLRSTDTDFARTLTMSDAGIEQSDGTADANCTVRATASDLLLWMCGRRAMDEATLSVEGDRSVAERLAALPFE